MERIDKVLANIGIGSRKEIKSLIRSGAVVIDGALCKDPGEKIDPDTAQVTVNGQRVQLEALFYFMMHKPAGYLSASRDSRMPTVMDLLEEEHKKLGLFPAGRLDRDSEGFLLLTNDGVFSHALTSPRRHVDKCYYIRYDGLLPHDAPERFREGIVIDGGEKCLPGDIKVLASGEAEVTIQEGRYHQVKRMIAALGGQVTYLKRVSIGTVCLDVVLKPGEYRPLTEKEKEALFSACKLELSANSWKN